MFRACWTLEVSFLQLVGTCYIRECMCGMCLNIPQFTISKNNVFLCNSTSSVSLGVSIFCKVWMFLFVRNCFWPFKFYSPSPQRSKTCNETSLLGNCNFDWYSSFICSKWIRMFLFSKWVALILSHCPFQFCFPRAVCFLLAFVYTTFKIKYITPVWFLANVKDQMVSSI